MEMIMKFLVDYYLVDLCIAGIGLFAFGLIYDRYRALYVDLALPAEPFMNQVMGMVQNDKIEEAITFCSANEKKPLAYVVKRVLERSDRESESIQDTLDIAANEVAPKLVKNLGHLSMVANVVTLVGLLGTVCGLIVAFNAVAIADVSQKQQILASGISLAMKATALGLLVAIPTMFFYSFLHAKQGQLFAEIDLHSQKVIDYIKSRGYVPFTNSAVYPSGSKIDAIAKIKNIKAA